MHVEYSLNVQWARVSRLMTLSTSKTHLQLNGSTMGTPHEPLSTLFHRCIYVPQDADLWRNIVAAHHDSAMTGHPGQWKTLELVACNYWWPGISRYVAVYVKGCEACNWTKTFPAHPVGTLMPNWVPDQRWQVVSTDLIGEFPEYKGYNAILVMVDRLSKWIHAVPTTTDMDSLGITHLFWDHIWRNHGLPEEVISNHRTVFISSFSDALGKLLGTKLSPSTAYHPQTDGQTKHTNQEVEQFLHLFVNHQQDDWSEWLPLAEFSYNNHTHAATCRTPFELDAGQHPHLGTEPYQETRCRQEILRICKLMKLWIFDTKTNQIQSWIYYDPVNVWITPENIKINISEIDS